MPYLATVARISKENTYFVDSLKFMVDCRGIEVYDKDRFCNTVAAVTLIDTSNQRD